MEYNDSMIENFKRILIFPNFVDLKEFSNETTKLSVLQSIYTITRSKMTTSLFWNGKPNFTVIDSEPNKDDKNFVTALVALHPIHVIFNKDEDFEYINNKSDFDLHPGDLMLFVNIEYEKVLSEHQTPAYLGYHFRLIKYRLKEKVQNGNGQYKYKASIVFSDKYEIEVFANDEKEAHEVAAKIPFYDWDHIFDVDRNRINEYNVQESRHSVWLPEQIIVKKDGE
jgi:hypothetical protein